MYVKGPDNNTLLTLSNAASPSARGGWQTGQLLKAMVVSVDRQGTPTLEINGRQVTAQSQGGLALRLGQMLQLEVVENGKTPLLKVLNPPANPQETMSRGVRESLPQQQPLTQVLNSLQQLAQGAKGEAGQQLRALSRQLMEQLPQPKQLQSGAGVKQAVEDSGHFLEAKLKQLLRNTDGNQDPQARLGRDLKAGLLRLLQAARALQQGSTASSTATRTPATATTAQAAANPQGQTAASTTQGSGNPQAPTTPTPSGSAPQAQAQAANIPQSANLPQANAPAPQGSSSLQASQTSQPPPAQETPEANPGSQASGQGTQTGSQAAQTSQTAAQTAAQKGDMQGVTLRQTQQGQQQAVQNQAQTASNSHSSGQDAAQASAKTGMHTSQQHLESGLARIQFNQLHSLQQSDNQQKPSWLLEIPIRQAEGRVNTLQLEIQRDREGDGKEKSSIWSLSLSFDLKELGAVRAGLTLVGEKQVGVNLWAAQASTAELFQQHMEQLRHSMQEAGLYVGQVGVQQGIPEAPPRHKPFADNTLVDVQA